MSNIKPTLNPPPALSDPNYKRYTYRLDLVAGDIQYVIPVFSVAFQPATLIIQTPGNVLVEVTAADPSIFLSTDGLGTPNNSTTPIWVTLPATENINQLDNIYTCLRFTASGTTAVEMVA